jgi:hypothetical protein
MHSYSAFSRFARSSLIVTLIPLAQLGCSNAPAGARQTTDQAADTLPPSWSPRAIQAPRPAVQIDTLADSLVADSARADSSLADTSKAAVAKRRAAKMKKDPFPLIPSDSARWPVPGAPDPLPGAIIPEHRIVAFYGNPLSKRMGILGQIDPDSMLQKLEATATEWAKADPERKVLPALHLIAVVAQGYPGPARKYRLQMPDSVIERVAGWAEQKGWLLFLDIQPGLSTVADEIPHLVKFLTRPYVHLALDPEFAMNASQIRLDPRVQVVIDMDGYGAPSGKKAAYRWFVVRHPVQYTGWKLFYKNDKPMMTPQQVLELYPKPMYIQYQ